MSGNDVVKVNEDTLDLAIAEYLTRVDDGSTVSANDVATKYDVAVEDLNKFLRAECELSTKLSKDPEDAPNLDHYEILSQLGSGSFGTVWKARDTKLDRIVAIKMPNQVRSNHLPSTQFLREARNSAQLNHPNIVSVFDVAQHEGTVYIVSEFIDGRTLSQSVAEAPFTQSRSVELCELIADALQHAHDNGVIHRDVKTSNIMLTYEHEPKLTDFGLSRRSDDIRLTGDYSRIGTPAYMSPELAAGKAKQADQRTDVYSLGVVLFELLTGELPFRGNTDMVLHQILRDPAINPSRLRSGLSRDLETICLKCLEKEPEKRYQTARALSDDLGRFLNHQPIQARRMGPLERSWRWCKRNVAVSLLLCTVAATLIAGAVVSSSFAMRAAREAKTSKAVSNFLTDLFVGAQAIDFSHYVIGGGSVENAELPAIELVDRGYERLKEKMLDEPETRSHLFSTLGEVYMSLGQTDKAVAAIEDSNTELAKLSKQNDLRILNGHNLAVLKYLKGDWRASRSLFEEAIILGESNGLSQSPTVLSCKTLLTMLLSMNDSSSSQEAYKEMRSILADCRKASAEGMQLRTAIAAMAYICTNQGRDDEAKDYIIELAALDTKYGASDTLVALRHYAEGNNLIAGGDYEAALPKLDEAVRLSIERLGPKNLAIDSALYDYLRCLLVVEGVDAVLASELYATYVSVMNERFGKEHPRYNYLRDLQGGIARRQGNHAEDVRLMRQAVQSANQVDDNVVLFECKLARALTNAGHAKEANTILSKTWARRTELQLSQFFVVRISTEFARSATTKNDRDRILREARELLESVDVAWLGEREQQLPLALAAMEEVLISSPSPVWQISCSDRRYID